MGAGAVIDEHGETSLDDGWPVEPGDALVVATSGSTGVPKGVVLTHDAVAASAHATGARLGTTQDDHWLACLPLSHVGGLAVVTRAMVLATSLTVLPGFDPVLVAGVGATHVSLVATALRRIDPAIVPHDRPRRRRAARRPPAERRHDVRHDRDRQRRRVRRPSARRRRRPHRRRRRRSTCAARCCCGPTATAPTPSTPTAGWRPATSAAGSTTAGCTSRAAPATSSSRAARTCGRSPSRRRCASDPASLDVAVTGTPDDEWGHVVTAVVVPSQRRPADARRACGPRSRRRCRRSARPRRLVIVDAIPRTALGKVRRPELRRLAGG